MPLLYYLNLQKLVVSFHVKENCFLYILLTVQRNKELVSQKAFVQLKTLDFYLVSYGSAGSFSHCETGEPMFVNVRSNEKPCCHTKHRNFPVNFCFCTCSPPVIPNHQCYSAGPGLSTGVWLGQDWMLSYYCNQHPMKAVINKRWDNMHTHKCTVMCIFCQTLWSVLVCSVMFTWQEYTHTWSVHSILCVVLLHQNKSTNQTKIILI